MKYSQSTDVWTMTSHESTGLVGSITSPYSIMTRTMKDVCAIAEPTTDSKLESSSSSSSSLSAVSLKSARNSAIAGYSAGFVGVVFGHPLDSLKVWAQTSSSGKNKHFWKEVGNASTGSTPSTSSSVGPQHASIASPSGTTNRPTTRTMSTLVSPSSTATKGTSVWTSSPSLMKTSNLHSSSIPRMVRALYSGASVPLFTVGIVQSINFATYDGMRRILHKADKSGECSDVDYLHNDSLWNVAVAGFVTGTGLAYITSPLIMIKTSQQVTGNGFREAVRSTLFPQGRLNLSGCFAGFSPHLASETIGRAVYYAVYEACKRHVSKSREEQGLSSSITLIERMGAAATAGVVCWTAIYPMDVLRNRMYSQVGRATAVGGPTTATTTLTPTLSTWEMAKCIYREKAMYRGFSLTVLRAGPVAAMVLPVYDLVLEYLSTSEV